jgi:hypothetical protein
MKPYGRNLPGGLRRAPAHRLRGLMSKAGDGPAAMPTAQAGTMPSFGATPSPGQCDGLVQGVST